MVPRWHLLATVIVLMAILSGCGGGGSASNVGGVTPIAFVCPKAEFPEGSVASYNANSHADEAMVPGQPDKALLCRYFGLNQGPRPEKLAASHLVSAQDGGEAELNEIVRGMNQTRPFIEEAHTCPSDEAVAIYVLFHYPNEPPVIVDARPGGCSSVTNGQADGGYPQPGLFRLLEELVPLHG
jgi:hypothetical protein